MKTLYESILDDEEDVLDNQDLAIKEWIKNNYKLIRGTITVRNNIVDVDGYMYIKAKTKTLTNGNFQFGTMNGDFSCYNSRWIESLEGAPKVVHGNFFCSHCPKLTSLNKGPEIVDGAYECGNCNNLESLEGAPKHVTNFNCSYCPKLTSLKGCPETIDHDLYIYGCKNLKSLDEFPKQIGGNIGCSDCQNLKINNNIENKYKDKIVIIN